MLLLTVTLEQRCRSHVPSLRVFASVPSGCSKANHASFSLVSPPGVGRGRVCLRGVIPPGSATLFMHCMWWLRL